METSAGELADLFKVSVQTITKLAREGIVVRTDRGKYELEPSITNYICHLRETAAGRGGTDSVQSLTEERARLAKEQADHAALKNEQLRGELVKASDVEAAWTGIISDLRAGMLAIPSRVQQRIPTLTADDVNSIDAEVREALTVLANDGAAE